MTRKTSFLALLLALLVWSYFARPIYDFARIAAGRIWDAQVERHAHPFVEQDYDAVLDAATEGLEPSRSNQYFNVQRRAAADAPAIRALDFSSDPPTSVRPEPCAPTCSAAWDTSPNPFPRPPNRCGKRPWARTAWRFIPACGSRSRPVSTASASTCARKTGPASCRSSSPRTAALARRTAPPTARSRSSPTTTATSAGALSNAATRVWEPMFIFYAKGQPDDLRERLSARALEAGTTLPALEILKTVRALDALVQRPEIDPARVAMVGMSYGGFYTLYTTALEPRIKTAVVAAYFNDRESVLDASEPNGFADWRFLDSLTLLRDPFIAALICPRALQIQAGSQDQLFPLEGARRAAPQAAAFYEKLRLGDRFRFVEFVRPARF